MKMDSVCWCGHAFRDHYFLDEECSACRCWGFRTRNIGSPTPERAAEAKEDV